jgi:hypothetical protein
MREALMLQLEKICYYQHLSLSGGKERPIFACRIVDIRGTRFHVLSRIQDAGLDFTGRTNFIAHHLVFTPEEIRLYPTPSVILREWPGWVKSWTKEPQLLENEDWAELTTLAGRTNVPAETWQRITGDAVNGYGLLEARAGASFRVDDQPYETVLQLLAESLELLEVRDTRRDFRTAAWNYTFTTSMQEQDNPADFRWRCIHSDNPAATRFATPDCRVLSDVRATKWTGEETAFARSGRQAPQFVTEPQNVQITEGESARLTAKAEGVPSPAYQWFSVDRANNGQVLPGETNPELVVSNPALGISRYVVNVTNSTGSVQSSVATLSVNQKLKLAQVRVDTGSRATAKPALYDVKSEEDIERQRRRLETEKAQEIFQKRLRLNKILVTILAIILIAGAGVFVWKRFAPKKSSASPANESTNKKDDDKHPPSSPHSATAQSATPTSQPNSHPSLAGEEGPDKYGDLLPPWASKNIGENTAKNFAKTNDFGIYFLAGGGRIFSQTNDNFFFVSQTVSNSLKFSAHLISDSTSNLCGLMMRESEKPDAPFAFIGASSNNIIFIYRPAKGETCTNIYETYKGGEVFLTLSRETNNFIGEFSVNEKTPKTLSKIEINTIPETNYLFGFSVCSQYDEKPTRAKFDKVKFIPTND